MRVLIGADIVPTNSNISLFSKPDMKELVGVELQEELKKYDLRIFNLETPICDKQTPIDKCGPLHIAPSTVISGLKELGCNLFTLANNHILDQGAQGLESTTDLLDENGICWVGAKSKKNIHKSFVTEYGNIKLGVYACAEHEFSIMTSDKSGAVPYDPIFSFDEVEELKKSCDYVIVLYHGGKEYYRYPSPQNQKVARHFVDKGADIILFQHSHCIGCYERYSGGTIVYGQGNFLFDSDDGEFGLTSMAIDIDFTQDGKTVRFIPLVNYEGRTRIANSKEGKEIIEAFKKRGEQIQDPQFVIKNYRKFAIQKSGEYLIAYTGNRFFLRVLRKIFGDKVIRRIYKKSSLLRMKNFSECEAHQEIFEAILIDMLEDKR